MAAEDDSSEVASVTLERAAESVLVTEPRSLPGADKGWAVPVDRGVMPVFDKRVVIGNAPAALVDGAELLASDVSTVCEAAIAEAGEEPLTL